MCPEEPLAGKSRIRRTLELVSTLISVSHSIRVFTVKWNSIRDKLEELSSTLSAFENCDSPAEKSDLSDSLEAVAATLESCLDLARRCADLSFCGKLQTQSDLDITSAKLDFYNKNLAEIHAGAFLSQGSAIVVSRPGLSASRDDIKFYINDLLSRLKIGCRDMKKQALGAFNEVIQEDERYVRIATEIDSFLALLVQCLDFEDDGIQEEALRAVLVISGFQACRGSLITSGVITPLIRVLQCGSDLSKENAARCLQKVTENSDNSWSVSSQGGITVLLEICSNNESRGELVALACQVLKNLTGVEEIKRFVIEERAIQTFVNLMRMTNDESKLICAVDFLQCLASGDESTSQTVIKEGGLQELLLILDRKLSHSTKTREMALKGVMSLCLSSSSSSEPVIVLLLNHGLINHILCFLREGGGGVQELALKAAFWLCGSSNLAKKAMGEGGVMPELLRFLGSDESWEAREMAAQTLAGLVVLAGNRKRFVKNEENVFLVLEMLEHKEFGNKKLLLSILVALIGCKSVRRKIVSCGYLKIIEKFADDDDALDAKKIVRKLSSSSSRFKNILSGIWHNS
ncbi:unnamed protein product [Cuscuta campestris]|uniref:DUF7032 domain-containing protein n=1 Tax=Cuscuta campestris TaxID=132261 RepID=A0A484M0I7_9ASTE|nr:unnamed protein product [Cuscuta campestris]